MDTKPLLYGLIGFFIGGLLVAVAATTFDKPVTDTAKDSNKMKSMASLTEKSGDEFDKAFIANMIMHHQSAVDDAKLSADRAKHPELKELSIDIVAAQEQEIAKMRQWQKDWGYESSNTNETHNMHQTE